jgi:hypothetical protein
MAFQASPVEREKTRKELTCAGDRVTFRLTPLHRTNLAESLARVSGFHFSA